MDCKIGVTACCAVLVVFGIYLSIIDSQTIQRRSAAMLKQYESTPSLAGKEPVKFFTLLVPPAESLLHHSFYDTRMLDCWIRQLLGFGIRKEDINVISAGNATLVNFEGEKVVAMHGVNLLRRPLVETANVIENYKYQYSKLWVFNETGYWVYLDTDLVFRQNPTICATACRTALIHEDTRVCAAPDVFVPIVGETYTRISNPSYFNAGFFASRGSRRTFEWLMGNAAIYQEHFRAFAEQGYLNKVFDGKVSFLPQACNYRRMWYEINYQKTNLIVIEHGKYGADPKVPIPTVCKSLYPEEAIKLARQP